MALSQATAHPARPRMADPVGFDGPRAHRFEIGGTTVWVEGFVRGLTHREIAEEAAARGPDDVAAWLDGLDGFHRIVVRGPSHGFAACDPVRTYPLVWGETARGETAGGEVVVGASGPALETALGLGPGDLSPDAMAPVTLSGFTIGAETLYRGVSQIGPGSYLWIDADGARSARYHLWDPWVVGEADADGLAALHERLIDDLVRDAGGRRILVPLSAGLDSRFVASGLKAAGYHNVVCVAYGLPGNREAETSQEIARRLGYPWHFVPYGIGALGREFRSDAYRAFEAASDSLTAVHFPQEFHTLNVLMESGVIDGETMVVNGQSGDFITGNHVPKSLFDTPDDPDARKRAILDGLLAKHYRQWASLRTPDRLDRIAEKMWAEVDALGIWPVGPEGTHGVYEFIEFQDRQSKYVVNGQRLYDHFGLDWRLPLWDRSCLDYWARAPLAAKKGQNLYRQVLTDTNWAGVWRDVPVNPTRVRPAWIRPLRLLAKAAHAPFGARGKAAWHRFEKRYFEYWMGTTCAFAAWPYREIAGDRRGHHSPIAWHIEAYLNGKGAAWDGTPLEAVS